MFYIRIAYIVLGGNFCLYLPVILCFNWYKQSNAIIIILIPGIRFVRNVLMKVKTRKDRREGWQNIFLPWEDGHKKTLLCQRMETYEGHGEIGKDSTWFHLDLCLILFNS